MFKNNFASLLIVCVILLSANCQKNEIGTDAEYLIFGTKYGHCIANCNKLYYLDKTNLYQYISSVREIISPAEFSTKGLKMSQTLFEKYKHLLNAIPSPLHSTELPDRFGCPNCYDQGAIVIDFKTKSGILEYEADTKIIDNPTWLQAYAEELRNAVEDLSK